MGNIMERLAAKELVFSAEDISLRNYRDQKVSIVVTVLMNPNE